MDHNVLTDTFKSCLKTNLYPNSHIDKLQLQHVRTLLAAPVVTLTALWASHTKIIILQQY